MFFGEKRAPGIITGKSLTGYQSDGDSFDRPDQPMVRIWLDHVPEGGLPGDDKLTLEVDKTLYPHLEVARHGTAVWRGKKLLRFETEGPQDAAPEQEPPSQGEAEEAAPEGGAAQTAQDADKTESASMACPWCGKPMTTWHLVAGRGDLTLESKEPGLFVAASDAEFIPLSGGFMESGHLLVWVCRDCEKAVIDYRDGACDYHQQTRKEYLFPL